MPKLLTREPTAASAPRSASVAALIASFETSSVQRSGAITDGDFRAMARDRSRSIDAAWVPIRSAALARGAY